MKNNNVFICLQYYRTCYRIVICFVRMNAVMSSSASILISHKISKFVSHKDIDGYGFPANCKSHVHVSQEREEQYLASTGVT